MKRGIMVTIMIFLLFQLVYCINVTPGNSRLLQSITIPDDFLTIQEGIDHAEPGSTIYVRNGTYIEHLTVNKPLAIIGENMLATIINATVNPIGIYVSADFVTIANFTIMGPLAYTFIGIELDRSRHCTLTGNMIVTGEFGIILSSSNENTISYNTMSSLYHILGIELHNSNDNVIIGNDAGHNDASLIIEGGCRNFVSSNTFAASWGTLGLGTGVRILGSNKNVLVKNTIYGVWGLEMENSQDTKIFHNSIGSSHVLLGVPDYGENVYLFEDVLNTSWDAGYPQGGNYWYGYNRSDILQGPYQNESGSDGIGDIPYATNSDNIDHYPLMQAPSLGLRDIGVADVKISKQVFGHETAANVTVKIVNFGNEELATNVTIHGNSTILEAFNATLLGKTVNAFTFVWNTTDLVNISYVVSVHADSVENETDTTDNVLTYGTVYFTIRGDVNADGVVDIYDAIFLAGHFNEDSFSPNWNMNIDFNGDEVIDIYDALILALNYERKLS